MNDHERATRALWKGPLIAWTVLLALFALTLYSAYLPLGTGNVALNLAIAALMLVILVVFLMDLRNANALLRIIAGAGLFWTAIMFALTFCDYFSRSY
jgi:caa(3)-type oxidase subunit IV